MTGNPEKIVAPTMIGKDIASIIGDNTNTRVGNIKEQKNHTCAAL